MLLWPFVLGYSSLDKIKSILRTEFRIPYANKDKSLRKQKIDKIITDYINKCDSISSNYQTKYKKIERYISITFAYYKIKPSDKFIQGEILYIKNLLIKFSKNRYRLKVTDPIDVEDVYPEYNTHVVLGLLGMEIIEE